MNVPQVLSQAWQLVKNQELDRAKSLLDSAIPYGFEEPVLLGALKSISFWKERLNILQSYNDPLAQADYFFMQWITYQEFAQRVGLLDEGCLYAFKVFVFGSVKNLLTHWIGKNDQFDPYYHLKLGICNKSMGDYEIALTNLEKAAEGLQDNPDLLSHLADCYALMDETPRAKILFREAFYLDAQQVFLEMLESELIHRLVDHVQQRFDNSKEVKEWIPVYGVILGVFSIKRDLRALEFGKLRQSIYALERELTHQPEKSHLIQPKLLNRYFWLIDKLVGQGEEQEKIDEVLLKIKSLNPYIHGLYTK